MTRTWTRGRRRGAAAGLSLAFHAAVLLLLGWSIAPRLGAPPRPAPPDLIVSLEPAPTTRAAVPERRPAPVTAPPVVAPRARVRPEPLAPRAPASLPAPAPALQGRTRGQAAPRAAAAHAEPLPAAEAGGDVRGALRATVGCEHRDAVGLTAAERERCNQTAGEVARAAPSFGPLPSEKLIGFSSAAAAAERRRAAREGPLSAPVQACQGQGSNLGLGCLPPEASHHIAIP